MMDSDVVVLFNVFLRVLVRWGSRGSCVLGFVKYGDVSVSSRGFP